MSYLLVWEMIVCKKKSLSVLYLPAKIIEQLLRVQMNNLLP